MLLLLVVGTTKKESEPQPDNVAADLWGDSPKPNVIVATSGNVSSSTPQDGIRATTPVAFNYDTYGASTNDYNHNKNVDIGENTSFVTPSAPPQDVIADYTTYDNNYGEKLAKNENVNVDISINGKNWESWDKDQVYKWVEKTLNDLNFSKSEVSDFMTSIVKEEMTGIQLLKLKNDDRNVYLNQLRSRAEGAFSGSLWTDLQLAVLELP